MAKLEVWTYEYRDTGLDLMLEWKEKMHKFKVGDVVRKKDGSLFSNDAKEITVSKIDGKQIWFAETGTYNFENNLELVSPQPKSPKSPIVEKTVKGIEPGVYGCVEIVGIPVNKTDSVAVRLVLEDGEYPTFCGCITASELESAAKTFMELAEYLRGKE